MVSGDALVGQHPKYSVAFTLHGLDTPLSDTVNASGSYGPRCWLDTRFSALALRPVASCQERVIDSHRQMPTGARPRCTTSGNADESCLDSVCDPAAPASITLLMRPQAPLLQICGIIDDETLHTPCGLAPESTADHQKLPAKLPAFVAKASKCRSDTRSRPPLVIPLATRRPTVCLASAHRVMPLVLVAPVEPMGVLPGAPVAALPLALVILCCLP